MNPSEIDSLRPDSHSLEEAEPVVVEVPMKKSPEKLDAASEQRLAYVLPEFADKIREFVHEFNSLKIEASDGTICKAAVFSGLRNFNEQGKLYAQGRTQAQLDKLGWASLVAQPDKPRVTNAAPGFSFHNYGLAVDVIFDNRPTTDRIHWSWDDKFPWEKMGEVGVKHGLEWGGNWKSFKDLPHYQMVFGLSLSQLRKLYKECNEDLMTLWEKLPRD